MSEKITETREETVEKGRNRLLCILTNEPEKFVEGIKQVAIRDVCSILKSWGIIPEYFRVEIDGFSIEIDELIKTIIDADDKLRGDCR